MTDDNSFTTQQQFAPLFRHRAELRRRIGLVLQRALVADVLRRHNRLDSFDLVIVQLSFTTAEATAIDTVKGIYRRCRGTPLVYFDGDDDLCIQWGKILEYVDLYVKKHVFTDVRTYSRQFIGKTNLTDYVSRTHGTAFDTNIIPRSGTVDAANHAKIYLGYGLGLGDMIADLFTRFPNPPRGERDVDIICRAYCSPQNWVHAFRGPLLRLLATLEGRYRVLLPDRRVSQSEYYEEMLRSRICVSPFGAGEVCWRDYEAVLCGCLLLKPEMGHLRTEPDIFVPYETYVPVRWDYSDLLEKCTHYLRCPSESSRISRNAHDVLADYLKEMRFIDNVRQMLQRLKIDGRSVTPRELT